MTEAQKNYFMVIWPMALFFIGSLFQMGMANQEIEQLATQQRELRPLVAQVAVLEANADQVKEDLVEIKEDVKLIVNVLITPKENQP